MQKTLFRSRFAGLFDRIEHRSRAEVRLDYRAQTAVTQVTVMLVDAISLSLAIVFSISAYTVFIGQPRDIPFAALAAFVATLIVFIRAHGLYKAGALPVMEFRGMMLILFVASNLGAVQLYLTNHTWQLMYLFFPASCSFVTIARSFGRRALVRNDWWGVRCFIYGADKRIESLFRLRQNEIFRGLRPVGFLQDQVPDGCSGDVSKFHLGRTIESKKLAEENRVSCAIVHRHGRSDQEIHGFIDDCLSGFARVIVSHDDPALPTLWSFGVSGHSIEDNLLKGSALITKRAVDLIVSTVGLVLGMPVLTLLAIWVRLTSDGPVFFGHTRIGKEGTRFKAWKFRTMVMNADEVLEAHLAKSPELREEWEKDFKLKDDPRVTSAGRFLRKTSLDELPQLWNIFQGEMSLVGPRPIVEGEVERYKSTFNSYLRVTPGLTGLWQVSGRNLTSYDRRVELDEFYVRNWSISFDIYILLRTVKTVLLREGAF